jgi:phosphate starvation-inducible PhoH-like protein
VSNEDKITKEYDDNMLLLQLVGPQNSNISRIEEKTGVSVHTMGNILTLRGPEVAITAVSKVLDSLYSKLLKGYNLETADIDAAIRMNYKGQKKMAEENKQETQKNDELKIITRKKHIYPRTPRQAKYIEEMNNNVLVFGLGPAGTGKTYLAVAKAVELMIEGKVDKIILSRPAVEAGENLGFLPGDLKEKIDPYLRPLYDALYDMLPHDIVEKKMEIGEIEIAPLAYMRGRTLSNSAVILDEAQNTTPMQMKMFLTRMGENSTMVINGDMSQTDLPRGTKSGMRDALEILTSINGISVIEFDESDVVRHGLVSKIVKAYDDRAKLKAKQEV